MAVWQDVGQGTLLTKLAVALCEVLARRAFRQRLVRVQEGTGLACLACALAVELAGDMRGVCGGGSAKGRGRQAGRQGHTLVVWGAAGAGEAHVAQVWAVVVSGLVDASAWDSHGRVSVCASHCARGEVVAEVARGSWGEFGCGRRVGLCRGWVKLVGKGSVWERRWWGLVVGFVVAGVEGKIRGRKCRHGAGAGGDLDRGCCCASRSGVGGPPGANRGGEISPSHQRTRGQTLGAGLLGWGTSRATVARPGAD